MINIVLTAKQCNISCDLLAKHFNIHDIGPIKLCLGMQYTRDHAQRSLTISQDHYFGDILAHFDMTNVQPFSTPMKVNLKLDKWSEPSDINTLRTYQRMLGSLMYVSTCPNLAYTTCYLAQFASALGPEHLEALKHMYHYLASTSDYAIVMDGTCKLDFIGYSDSDWASDHTDWRSITGYTFTLAGNIISWSSWKQPSIALSSTEGEYMAVTEASREATYLQQFLLNLGFTINNLITIHVDNLSAIQLALNTSAAYSARTKHIDTRHHWIWQQIANGIICLKYIPSANQTAAILTKALPSTKVQKFCANLCMKSVQHRWSGHVGISAHHSYFSSLLYSDTYYIDLSR
jgi:hypothetical protein